MTVVGARSAAVCPDLLNQAVFRGLVRALSRPGGIVELPGGIEARAPLPAAVAAVCLCLVDGEAAVWLDAAFDVEPVRDFLRFYCNASITADPARADFALVGDAAGMPRLDSFARGEATAPDGSTTLFVAVSSLDGGPVTRLAGPGIEPSVHVAPADLPGWFWSDWDRNTDRYPLGVDLFFCAGTRVLGLPRTARRI